MWQSNKKVNLTRVLHMCFDRFLLAFESRDLSQADKIIIGVSSFPKLSGISVIYCSVNNNLYAGSEM